MTPDERNLLSRFLGDLTRITGAQKDPEAAGLIAQSINANPDAPYLLVQHAIIADQALATAQARIAELEDAVRRQEAQQPPQPGPAQGGFLGGLFGGGQHGPTPAPTGQGPWGGPQPTMVTPQMQPQQGGFFGGGAPAQPGGMSSFLKSAGTTAAGVAGGAFLFQGVSNLFGGQHGGQGFLGGGGQPEEVVNNYYNDPAGGQGSSDDGGYDAGNGDAGGDDHS